MAKKVYAIKEGFDNKNNKKVENLIVNTWAECLSYVKGVKGARYKSFESLEAAKKFLNDSNDVLKKEDDNYPKDCLHIYVDGSYNISTEEYSYGLVAVKDDIVEYIESGCSKSNSSNNIRQIAGELEAAVKGVEYAIKRGENKVVIFHDYIGICYHATGFWERKEESSINYYNKMQELMKLGIEIVFVKVDSHTGDLFNELADEKCKEKLGIDSDNIVSKWLKTSKIQVASNYVFEEIKSIARGNEDNIVLYDSLLKDKEQSNIDEKLHAIIKLMNNENKQKLLEYAEKISK